MPLDPHHYDLRLALDSIRDDADLARPEMAALADRVQKDAEVAQELTRAREADGKIRAALEDVEPPPGFEERMLAALRSDLLATSATKESTRVLPATARAPRGGLLSRRRVLTATLIAVAASALGAFGIYLQGKPLRASDLKQEALQFLAAQETDSNWSPEVTVAAETYPFAKWLRRPPERWRMVTVQGISAALYDLEGADGSGALLLVVPTTRQLGLAARPDHTGYSMPGQPQSVAWQDGRLVYVLALEGGRLPKDFLRQPALALHARQPDLLASR